MSNLSRYVEGLGSSPLLTGAVFGSESIEVFEQLGIAQTKLLGKIWAFAWFASDYNLRRIYCKQRLQRQLLYLTLPRITPPLACLKPEP